MLAMQINDISSSNQQSTTYSPINVIRAKTETCCLMGYPGRAKAQRLRILVERVPFKHPFVRENNTTKLVGHYG